MRGAGRGDPAVEAGALPAGTARRGGGAEQAHRAHYHGDDAVRLNHAARVFLPVHRVPGEASGLMGWAFLVGVVTGALGLFAVLLLMAGLGVDPEEWP